MVVEYTLQFNTGLLPAPISSFYKPVLAPQEDVLHILDSLVAGTFISIRLVDAMEVRSQAKFSSTHLGDDRADRSRQLAVQCEVVFVWFPAEQVKLTSALGTGPDIVPVLMGLRVDSFLSYCEQNGDIFRWSLVWQHACCSVDRCVGGFVAWDTVVCWDPPEGGLYASRREVVPRLKDFD